MEENESSRQTKPVSATVVPCVGPRLSKKVEKLEVFNYQLHAHYNFFVSDATYCLERCTAEGGAETECSAEGCAAQMVVEGRRGAVDSLTL